jgi:primosomal protein N' (replication factor Y)
MNTAPAYIDVAVSLPVWNTFTYGVPEALALRVQPGKRVLVPFRQSRVTGYVLGSCCGKDLSDIRSILDVLDEEPLFPSSMIPFFQWTSRYYMHPLGEVIKAALPSGINLLETVTLHLTRDGEMARQSANPAEEEKKLLDRVAAGPCPLPGIRKQADEPAAWAWIRSMEKKGWLERRRVLNAGQTRPKTEWYACLCEGPRKPVAAGRKKIVEFLAATGEASLRHLHHELKATSRLIRKMGAEGILRLYPKPVYRDPFGESILPDRPPALTCGQQKAVETVLGALGEGFRTYLLAGVTGSGKTEVYMQLASEALGRGCSVLVLVPEIALISQMERRFRARFGERIAVLHSGLSAGERYDQWMRIRRGEATIVIGARSAVFAPFEKIGLIVVDEEHDPSYKQDRKLRYNACDLAVVRAKQLGAVALLGSATPSVQSCHNVAAGKFIELTLESRVEQRPLPEITVVDLCGCDNRRGARRFITAELEQAMKETLERGEQVLLFLNRRGFSTYPVCSACGKPFRCKNCDITLTLHRQANAYRCHFCGFSRASVSPCPQCGSTRIRQLGFGTEKVEASVSALFPSARVARLDSDTASRRGSIVKILKSLRDREIDVLVGTQMVAKGHDFPGITLVGIVCADLSLSFPDFRAGERTFQLLAQVSGRAGRGEVPGRVILQTYNTDHFSIQAARQQDFRSFYATEIAFRRQLNYPPFSRLVQLRMAGKEREAVAEYARQMGARCRLLKASARSFTGAVEVLGPVEAPLARIAGKYRFQILLKGTGVKDLHPFVRELLSGADRSSDVKGVHLAVDVDPVFLL